MDFHKLTLEEQRAHTGMWCDTPAVTGIIVDVVETARGYRAQIFIPSIKAMAYYTKVGNVTIRHDLRRAWQADREAINA